MLGIIFLAIIQGITEFLPISSSAHLIIFRTLFNIGNLSSNMSLVFDIALHLGTLLSIIIYFYKDLFNLIKNIFKDNKLIINLIISTIPAAIIGFLLEDIIDNLIRNNLIIISISLIVMGFIIYFVDKKSRDNKKINDITCKDSLLIGIAQVFALIPGFSRSGVTISMSRFLKINKEDATKYSFYLSIPIILGASFISLLKDNSINLITSYLPFFIIGILVSFISGLLCINYLLKYIKKHDFSIFMWYRLILGIITIMFLIFR